MANIIESMLEKLGFDPILIPNRYQADTPEAQGHAGPSLSFQNKYPTSPTSRPGGFFG